MEIKVNELTSVDKEITILANREDLQPKFDKAYAGIRPKVNLPGFRPGRAPIGLIKKRYGQEIEIEEICFDNFGYYAIMHAWLVGIPMGFTR